MKQKLTLLALLGALVFQTGCISSPISVAQSPLGFGDMTALTLGTAGGALIGQSMNDSWGAPVGAAVALAGTATYLQYQKQHEAQLVAEAKEEARREERAIVMRDYWQEATGADYAGNWTGKERDVRYDAGVYDGVRYESRNLPRQLYFQEPAR